MAQSHPGIHYRILLSQDEYASHTHELPADSNRRRCVSILTDQVISGMCTDKARHGLCRIAVLWRNRHTNQVKPSKRNELTPQQLNNQVRHFQSLLKNAKQHPDRYPTILI